MSYLTSFSRSRPDLLLAGTLALVLAGGWVSLKESNVTPQKSTVSCAIHVKNETPRIRKVRHVSSKESNVTGVIFDSFSDHMAGDLIIFP